MGRKEELLKIFEKADESKKTIAINLIDDVVYLEKQLTTLRGLPFIKIKVGDPTKQKSTSAAKQYKEMLQQYNNCIKLLCSLLSKDDSEDVSPLREYMKRLNS